MRTWMMVIGLVVGLAGCATQKKPDLALQNYPAYATRLVGIELCHSAGDLNTELAAQGLNATQQRLNTWTYSNWELNKAKEDVRKKYSYVPKDVCSKLALEIQQEVLKAQQNRQEANVVYQSPQWTTPQQRNTYCNQIGSQILCNSF